MIDLPMNAEVQCSDGLAGHSTHVVVNPISKHITHLVVKGNWPFNQEYMVPIEQVDETAPGWIRLKCSNDDLQDMQAFVSEEYIPTRIPDFDSWQESYVAWPMVLPAPGYSDFVHTVVAVQHDNMPEGELSLHRGAKVEATDGYLGLVDELLVNSHNMHVTHLILRERHILKRREVAIPVSQIDHVDEERVYLKLDKKTVEELPTVPVQRWTM